MTDKVIRVNVTASKSQKVTVSSSKVANEITASPDTSAYYSRLAKNWAIAEGLVENIDYSSKHYAQESKASADMAKTYETATQENYNMFMEASVNANSELQTNRDGALVDIEGAKTSAIDSLNSIKDENISTIESKANEEIENLNKEIEQGKDEIKDTIDGIRVLTTLEIGTIGFTQGYVDESKGLRRCINKVDNIIIQDQYPEFTKWLKTSVSLNPDLACTEEEWQTELTMSANGICYKYVIDDEAGTIRLPKYPDYLDLSINGAKTVSVYGNGKTLGVTNGSVNGGLYYSAGSVNSTRINKSAYGTNIGTSYTSADFTDKLTIGITRDATKSGITGSVTTSSEQIKGTYFIQVATGAETEDNIINEIELNNPFSLLDYKYSEYELNNLSWLRSNGQYNSKITYPAVYELLLKIYNGTETKAGVSVKLSTETFTDTDFVLNTADETFRLPIKVKQKFFNSGNVPVVGNGMTLGLRQGSNSLGLTTGNDKTLYPSAAAYGTNTGTSMSNWSTVSVANMTMGVTTDSSKSGLIAKLSSTEVSGLYLYFYVGETVQNANLINAGRIEEKIASCITRNDCKAYIVESYVNGTSWYNLYSNGWIEQGGRIVINSATVGAGTYNNTTLTFIKPFSKLMSWHCQARHDRFNAGFNANVGGAVSSVDVYQVNDSSNASFSNAFVIWEAKGYIA